MLQNINNHIGDGTSKHVEKKELLLNHQSHVENPSFSESNSISWDNGLLDTNSNGNTLLENEYGRISDLPNLQYDFTQDCKAQIKDYESISLNVSCARFSQDSISPDNIIENIKTSSNHAENLHKKNQECPSRLINIKENVSRNCNRLPIKDMNIKRNDLIEGSKLDDKITEVIEENCDIESSIPNQHKPYRSFLSPNINTNPITMEEKSKFFINNCSISVATETNNNNIMTKHNSIIIPIEEFRKILSNTVQQKHHHSLLSFFTAYDILKRIFNLLSIEDLLNAQKVCKMWNIFINEPTFWRKFILNNNQITDQIVDALIEHNTEHLIIHNDNDNWERFHFIIKKIVPLKVLELCDCPGTVVSWVIHSCPQLTTIRALSITNEEFVLPYLKFRSECKVLQLQCVTTMTLTIVLQNFMVFQSLTHLSLLTINNLTEQRFDFLYQLVNLEDLELGQFNGKVGTKTNDMSSYPHLSFSNSFLTLHNLKRFRLENIKTLCFTRLLQIISKLKKLTNLELANITLTQEFEDHLHLCTNINRLLLSPNYDTTPACSNTRILNSIYKLRKNLKHFIWDFSNESFQFSQTFCQQSRKYIPILSCQLDQNLTNIHLNDGSSLYNKKFKQIIKQLMNVACQDINYICNCWNIDAISSSSLQKFCNAIIPMTKVELLNIS
ncbi:PREDICTED: uncharacterized protein LOC105363724 [Ceratosolen solmsi marchali]|uniref:Uncharacterized protein LOC105363724 n=1 Tax=Ceratosolen solmsi marchali TaxID=326594 RepID=A0AAJ6YKL9_9HYME|nr:PREDICTED: uncharacterized protein LOC105363724 [Ceratosolen solmsi marchali]